MLMAVSDAQQVLVLRAMRSVATGAGSEALTDVDGAALVAAGAVLFRRPEPIDPDALDPVDPVELGAALAGPEADHVAQLLTVMAVVDGVVDDARIDTVERYAAALGVHGDYLRQLSALAERNLRWLVADVQRQNLRSITGGDPGAPIDEWIVPYRERPDPELAARYRALGARAEGTFGRTFAEFYERNGFAFPGDPAGVNAGFGTPHDSTHVLSGYDTTPQGEVLVSTFTAGMHPDRPMSGHILPVIMTFHMGIELVEFAGRFSGALDIAKLWAAWDRGTEVTTDVFAPDWDFWSVVERPLDDLRAEYRVPILQPRDAAGGEVPDWYRPSA